MIGRRQERVCQKCCLFRRSEHADVKRIRADAFSVFGLVVPARRCPFLSEDLVDRTLEIVDACRSLLRRQTPIVEQEVGRRLRPAAAIIEFEVNLQPAAFNAGDLGSGPIGAEHHRVTAFGRLRSALVRARRSERQQGEETDFSQHAAILCPPSS